MMYRWLSKLIDKYRDKCRFISKNIDYIEKYRFMSKNIDSYRKRHFPENSGKVVGKCRLFNIDPSVIPALIFPAKPEKIEESDPILDPSWQHVISLAEECNKARTREREIFSSFCRTMRNYRNFSDSKGFWSNFRVVEFLAKAFEYVNVLFVLSQTFIESGFVDRNSAPFYLQKFSSTATWNSSIALNLITW